MEQSTHSWGVADKCDCKGNSGFPLFVVNNFNESGVNFMWNGTRYTVLTKWAILGSGTSCSQSDLHCAGQNSYHSQLVQSLRFHARPNRRTW